MFLPFASLFFSEHSTCSFLLDSAFLHHLSYRSAIVFITTLKKRPGGKSCCLEDSKRVIKVIVAGGNMRAVDYHSDWNRKKKLFSFKFLTTMYASVPIIAATSKIIKAIRNLFLFLLISKTPNWSYCIIFVSVCQLIITC